MEMLEKIERNYHRRKLSRQRPKIKQKKRSEVKKWSMKRRDQTTSLRTIKEIKKDIIKENFINGIIIITIISSKRCRSWISTAPFYFSHLFITMATITLERSGFNSLTTGSYSSLMRSVYFTN